MEENKFHIIIVDDTLEKDDPLVVEMKIDYEDVAEVSLFNHVETAMTFVDNHMSERMIIFMDCKFGPVWQGVEAVLDLRKKTSLIYVVMMSANNINQLRYKDIESLINTDNVFFINNSDIDGAKEKVEKIRFLWKSQFDCVLESWLVRHPEDHSKVAMKIAGDRAYTWGDMLKELRLQSPVGKSLEQMVNQYYIYEALNEE